MVPASISRYLERHGVNFSVVEHSVAFLNNMAITYATDNVSLVLPAEHHGCQSHLSAVIGSIIVARRAGR